MEPSKNLSLSAFLNADWASYPNDRRSIVAYCIFLGDCLIAWSSKNHIVVVRFSTKSEYKALAHATVEIAQLKSLLGEIDVQLALKPVIRSNNLGVASLAPNPVYHARIKHIEIDMHFVRDMIMNK